MHAANPLNQKLIDLFEERFTCKRYDKDRTVTDEDFDTIMEVARLSPSSFGLEPWKMLVIENEDVLEEILACSWGAKKNAARTVVILARKHMEPTSPHVEHMMRDVQGLSEEDAAARRNALASFQENDLGIAHDAEKMFDWSRRQTYIMLANMLSAAAWLHIDATPIEGFNPEKLEKVLIERDLMDPEEFGVSLIAQFGYHDPTHRMVPKTRQNAADVIDVVL